MKDFVRKLRLLTANLIEQVKKWRNFLNINEERLEDRPIFYSRSSNYQSNILTQLLNDSNFILTSKLGNVINMGTRNDPFLLSPVKKAAGKEESPLQEAFLGEQNPVSIYAKFIDYLASEKAHEIKLNRK